MNIIDDNDRLEILINIDKYFLARSPSSLTGLAAKPDELTI